MKTNLILITVLILSALIIMGCTKSKPIETTEVVIIRDITDTLIANPKVEEITSMLDSENNLWNGAQFRLVDLSDVSYNPSHEAKIEGENEWLGNKYERQAKVKAFYTKINQIISEASKEAIGKNNSSVYFSIARELNKLSTETVSKKVVLIYSDLMEHTNELSFYDKRKLYQLKTKPEFIQQYFDSQLEIKNLKGICIYLIYQPTNTKEDEVYKLVSGFYKKMFESKGAQKVEITAGIN